jgi:hypothetical protein
MKVAITIFWLCLLFGPVLLLPSCLRAGDEARQKQAQCEATGGFWLHRQGGVCLAKH